MRCAIVSLLVFSAVAAAENLLADPGFEQPNGENPAAWHVFVEPQRGSRAAVDADASRSGRCCVMLHNEKPYPREPANNWSQNVLVDLSGKNVAIKGDVKTDKAGSAELWIQCFRKDPWGVLLQKSSADLQPLKGTHDWTPVEFHASIPKGTDFVVVRCVLKGVGTAWFDNISLETVASSISKRLGSDKPVTVPDRPISAVKPVMPQVPTMGTPPESGQEDIRAAQDAVHQANQALRDSNQELAKQLQALREQLQLLREQIREFKRDVSPSDVDAVDREVVSPVPPLVPHLPERRKSTP